MDDNRTKTGNNEALPVRNHPAGRGKGLAWTIGLAVLILIAAVLYVFALTYHPAYGSAATAAKAIALSTGSNGQPRATIQLDIQPTVNVGPHADWLGYQTRDGQSPGTIFHLPAHTLVTMVIHNYDSQTALRNTFFTQVQGTVGNVEYFNGKKITVMDPAVTSHTFTIADFGVSVPMAGVPSNAKPNQFQTMKFQFMTPGKGVYRWQCIVPCGWGLYGNGGPMQTIGYMDGIITVA